MHTHFTTPRAVRYEMVGDFPGYRIGDDGTAWTCWSRSNKPGMTAIWRPMKGHPQRSGHLRVFLRRNGKTHPRFIHRLVLEAFVGACPPGLEACHDPDRDPTNNRLDNLRWDTRQANCADARRHGTSCFVNGHTLNLLGEDHPNARLTQAQVEQIMEIRATTGTGARKICRQLGLPYRMYSAIHHVITGKSWNSVTGLPSYEPKGPSGRIPT